MITYEEMEVLSKKYAAMFEKGPCTTCYGGRTETACWEWLEELGHAKSRNCHGRFYANREECQALLKWHDDKYGSIQQAKETSASSETIKPSYCCKEFLTCSPEPSTSAVVSFYGDIKWSKDEDGGNVSFLEISNCHEKARLHRTFEMTELDWVNQVEKLRDHIDNYLLFLVEKLPVRPVEKISMEQALEKILKIDVCECEIGCEEEDECGVCHAKRLAREALGE